MYKKPESNKNKSTLGLWFGLIYLHFNYCFADSGFASPPPQSLISIGAGYDSDSNKNSNLFLDFELDNYQHLGFAYLRNQSAFDDSLTYNYSVFTSTSAYETSSIDLGFGYFKLSDAMESYSVNSALNLNLENWLFSASPQLKAITFFLNTNKNNKFDIYARGLELSASYFGHEEYYFTGSYFKNTFSEKPLFLKAEVFDSLGLRTVNKIRIITRISETTSNLEQSRLSATIGRYFTWGTLEFSVSYTELFNISQWLDFPALDDLKNSKHIISYSASSYYTLNQHFSFGFSGGMQSVSDDSSRLYFGFFDLNYSW